MTPSKDQNIFSEKEENQPNDDFGKSPSIDRKIAEIEERIRNLYEKNIPDFMQTGMSKKEEEHAIGRKLENISSNIKQMSDEVTSVPDELKTARRKKAVLEGAQLREQEILEETESLRNLEDRLRDLSDISAEIESRKNAGEEMKDFCREEKTQDLSNADRLMKDRLEKIDSQIQEIKHSITSFYKTDRVAPSSVVEERLKNIEEKLSEDTKSPAPKSVPHGPITLRPKQKKEGLFNDANLTEDYELGFRFYQLGFKTGFFNVKLDRDDEASRIATAEFFPNTFWASVKQRSRWVAGIVFQNWKAHKWSGNLSTKYFLFRDRKSIFSFFSAFLSNIVIVYFIYAMLSKAFGWPHVNSLVGSSSVLWYLMIANLFFMISRLSHRFVFTYNWYGFRYAFFSLFRLPLDTVINFFAIARSLNVYKNVKSKAKVVWDSTSHY
ncbi:MAG: hypothetical protein LWX07_09265 [Bacteroidetes bacterium]|nr:hypothetical protein [Bacteroidota bacterium]